jgi:hypothetical protein
VHFQPAAFNGEFQSGAVLRGRALVAEQEGTVEFFDIDAAILNRFEGARVLQEATGGPVRIGKWAIGGQFQIKVSCFPMLGEWHSSAVPVMPVRHDVHRTCRATLAAYKARADLGPR